MDEVFQALIAGEVWFALHCGAFLAAAGALALLAAGAILLRVHQGRQLVRRGQLFQIAVPQGTEVQPFGAEQMFAAIQGLQEHWWPRLWHGPRHISLEIAGDSSGIRFYLWAPAEIAAIVVREIHSTFEEADIRALPRDYLDGPGPDALGGSHRFPALRGAGQAVRAARLQLRHDIALPIKTLKEFEKTDPLAAITAAMTGLQEGEGVLVQLLLQPGGDGELRQRAESRTAAIERRRTVPQRGPTGQVTAPVTRDYTAEEQQQVKSIGGKRAKICFRVALRLLAIAPDPRSAAERRQGLAAAYAQFDVATLNSWWRRDVWFLPRRLFLRHLQQRAFPLWGRKKAPHPLVGEHDVLNIEEAASLWHLPHPQVVQTPGIVWSLSRKRAAGQSGLTGPADGLVIARTVYHGERKNITLPVAALSTHVGIVGKHGTGKSTLLARIALECIQRRISLVLLDPHGDLCEDLLARIPADARERVIYFNPFGDQDRPPGLNFLEPEPGQRPAKVCGDVVDMLMHLFGHDLVGPRSAYILRNAMRVLLEVGGMTLLEVEDLLQPANTDFRAAAAGRVTSPAAQKFLYGYVETMIKRNVREYMASINPVINKVGAFSADPCVANVIGQATSSFRLRDVLDGGGILLCNLAQGNLGEDNSRLLAGAIASRAIQAGMARTAVPPEQRYPAVIIADEFHAYVTPAFPSALVQLRKYRVGLVLAAQLLAQVDQIPELRPAFLAAETLCAFRVTAEDAIKLAAEFTGFFDADDLVRLDAYQVAIRIAAKQSTLPFSGETVPLDEGTTYDPAAAAEIHTRCRELYGRPRDEVEQAIARRGRFHLETAPAAPDPPTAAPALVTQEVKVYDVPEI